MPSHIYRIIVFDHRTPALVSHFALLIVLLVGQAQVFEHFEHGERVIARQLAL